MDGDLQHNPKYIKKMIEVFILNKSDIVIGIRDFSDYSKNSISLFLRLNASIILKSIINTLLGFRSTDPLSGFFLFKKKIYVKNRKKFFGKGYKILADFLYNVDKIKVLDFKIKFNQRKSGKSKMNTKILLQLLQFITLKFFKRIIK